jgi:hypothetical protein
MSAVRLVFDVPRLLLKLTLAAAILIMLVSPKVIRFHIRTRRCIITFQRVETIHKASSISHANFLEIRPARYA